MHCRIGKQIHSKLLEASFEIDYFQHGPRGRISPVFGPSACHGQLDLRTAGIGSHLAFCCRRAADGSRTGSSVQAMLQKQIFTILKNHCHVAVANNPGRSDSNLLCTRVSL